MKLFLTFAVLFFASFAVLAQDVPPVVLPPGDFLTQVVDFIKGFGGLPSLAKISGVLVILVASMKVTFLNDLVWSKLGKYQLWVAPILGLLVGLFSQGTSLTLASAFAFISAGAGAVALHEVLDLVKVIPGLGSLWVSVIEAIESVLGGPAPTARLTK